MPSGCPHIPGGELDRRLSHGRKSALLKVSGQRLSPSPVLVRNDCPIKSQKMRAIRLLGLCSNRLPSGPKDRAPRRIWPIRYSCLTVRQIGDISVLGNSRAIIKQARKKLKNSLISRLRSSIGSVVRALLKRNAFSITPNDACQLQPEGPRGTG